MPPKTLPAFTETEKKTAHQLLASTVVYMMGRKFEEGDWANVYCQAKNLRCSSWSNLNIDVMYNGLGVEHKMLRVSSENIKDECGKWHMHPSATRSIRINPDHDALDEMRNVLTQYGNLINQRKAKVRETNPNQEPDMRTGWLLWQSTLREFLYFEEEMFVPNPEDYTAEWRNSGTGKGARKASNNLWIYEKSSGQKKYSVTTSAGAKIQPYFLVPPPNDPNLNFFRVQGEELANGIIRLWAAKPTAQELSRLLGTLETNKLSSTILEVAHEPVQEPKEQRNTLGNAVTIEITAEAYGSLIASFPGVSDEHRLQMLIDYLKEN